MSIQPISAPSYPQPVTPVAPIQARTTAPTTDSDGDRDQGTVEARPAAGTGTLVDIKA